jgi:predicted signal transduction protein with EAL and GGDEF domain
VVCAGLLYFGAGRIGDRLPLSALHILFVVTILSIGATALGGSGEAATAAVATVVWVALYAFAFFSWRAAVLYVVLDGGICIGVLVARHLDAAGVGPLILGPAIGGGVVVGYLSSRLRRQAMTDPLTALPNRQAIGVILEHEMARAGREGRALSLAIFDLDHFKEVNDREGHHAGDRVLAEVASSWRGAMRAVDVLGRYAGDELWPSCPTATATRRSRSWSGPGGREGNAARS